MRSTPQALLHVGAVGLLVLVGLEACESRSEGSHGVTSKNAANIEVRNFPFDTADSRRTYSMPLGDVVARLREGLADQGLTIIDEDGSNMIATGQHIALNSWASCPTVWNTDRSNESRSRRARPIDRSMQVVITLDRVAGGTTVAVDTRFSERQHNTLSNTDFTVLCDSTGAFESMLLTRVTSPVG